MSHHPLYVSRKRQDGSVINGPMPILPKNYPFRDKNSTCIWNFFERTVIDGSVSITRLIKQSYIRITNYHASIVKKKMGFSKQP
jgi:hypothetical protein